MLFTVEGGNVITLQPMITVKGVYVTKLEGLNVILVECDHVATLDLLAAAGGQIRAAHYC
jgi:hypothetical protein